jgi:DNA-binding PadR family transcriptional regulator
MYEWQRRDDRGGDPSHCRHDPRGVHGSRGMSGPRGMHVRGSVSEGSPRSVARGGIRFAILGMLKERPRHGYDLIREMEDLSGGLYSPSPGAIYPTLQALEDESLVTSVTEEGKKVYAISEAGTVYLDQHKDRADSHRERWQAQWGSGQAGGTGETLSEIHEALDVVKRAVRDSAGDAGRLGPIAEILKEAAAKIGDVAGR